MTAPEPVGVGVMMDLDTIVLMEPQLASACCSQEEWRQFIRELALKQAEREPKDGLGLTLPQRNSLLTVEADHL